MSDFLAIVLLLALFLSSFFVCGLLARTMYKRCDDILSGVVNGATVSLRSRWLFTLHDYMGHVVGLSLVAGVMGIGMIAAGEALGDSNAAVLAQVCAVPAFGFFFFALLLGIIWMRHFVAMLREAEAD